MSNNHGALKKGTPPEKIISLLYTAGFRLTGSHRSAALLVDKALRGFEQAGRGYSPRPGAPVNPGAALEAIKYLCRAFAEEGTPGSRRQPGADAAGVNQLVRYNNRVQEALLGLEPGERTALVLRDHLGLNYTEIATVTMAGEKVVAARIASARWALKKLLAEGTDMVAGEKACVK